ncbi:hypothetical protein D3C71_1931930 [compost metagenome]
MAKEYDALADTSAADDGDEVVIARLHEIEAALAAMEEMGRTWRWWPSGCLSLGTEIPCN